MREDVTMYGMRKGISPVLLQPVFRLLILAFFLLLCLYTLKADTESTPSSVIIDRFRDVPVDMASGELRWYEKPDLSIRSRGGNLSLSRGYKSQRDFNGPFGSGWTWSHCERLVFKDGYIIEYHIPDAVIPIYPDVLYTGAYCSAVISASGWENPKGATGKPDASGPKKVAHYFGTINSIHAFTVSGWNFVPPQGASSIIKIDLTSIAATSYDKDHPKFGATLKLSAGGTNSVLFGHRLFDIDYTDITSDRASWTWADVNNIQAKLELGTYKRAVGMDVVIDTFHVGVTYVPGTNGTFKYKPGANFVLERVGGEYHIVYYDGYRVVFGSDGRLLRKQDSNGNITTCLYDEIGRMNRICDPVGQFITLNYDGNASDAFVTNIVDNIGRVCSFKYANGNLVEAIDCCTNSIFYEYSTNTAEYLSHNLLRRTDAEGTSFQIEYYTSTNLLDRVKVFRNALGQDVFYSYAQRATYSAIPGMGSFQGVAFNVSNDITQVFIRQGELVQTDSDGTNLVVSHSASIITGSGNWTNSENAAGITNDTWAVNNNMTLSSNTLTATGWMIAIPEASNDIAAVYVSVYGTASNLVRLSAGGTAGTNWQSSVPVWTEVDVTTDKTDWTWEDVNNLAVSLTRPDGSADSASVEVDAFALRVTYRFFDPGEKPEDRFYCYDLAHNLVSSRRDGRIHSFSYDDWGNIVTHTTPLEETLSNKYENASSRLVQTTDALGRITRYEYDARGNRIKSIDALGNATLHEYDRWGNLVKTTDPQGNTEQYFYDAAGLKLVRARDKRGLETTFDYDQAGNLVRKTNSDGTSTHARYNALNLKVWGCDEAGIVTEMFYDRNGRLTKVITASGTPDEMLLLTKYDALGRVIEKIDTLGNSERFTFDEYNNPVVSIDKIGSITHSSYDIFGRLIWQSDPIGGVVQNIYDGSGNVLTNIDKRGFITTFSYDLNNRMIGTVDKGGNSITYAYDAVGNKTQEVFNIQGYPGCTFSEIPPPLVVSYACDAMDRVTNKVVGFGRADARVSVTQFNSIGRPVRQVDPAGFYNLTAYDPNGNVTNVDYYFSNGRLCYNARSVYNNRDLLVMQISQAGSVALTNSFEYDARGLKTATIDPMGNRTVTGFDAQKRPVSLTDAAGNVRTVQYNAVGNKVREVNPAGTISEYYWDAAGRMTDKITGVGRPDARLFSYTYDNFGRVLSETDPLGNITFNDYDEEGNLIVETGKHGFSKYYAYDPLGRLTNTIDELGYSIQQRVDGRGKPCKLIDRMGHVLTTTYDVYGQVTGVVDALGNAVSFAYDSAGRKISETDQLGLRTDYAYDDVGRVTNKTVGAGLSSAMTFRSEYDGFGRLVKAIDPDGGFSTQSYDGNGNVLARTDRRGFQTRSCYDCLNRVTNTVDAADGFVLSVYDAMGNLVESTDAFGNKTLFTYDAYNLKETVTDAAGQTARFAYDLLGRMTNVTDALGSSESTTYDAIGNVLSKKDRNGAVSSFFYDPLGRVTNTVDALGFTTAKTYDPNSNVLNARDKRGYSMSYTYDASGKTLTVTDPYTNTVSFAYDAAGRKIREQSPSGLVTTFTYDIFGRPVSKTAGAGRSDARTTSQQYDSLGRVTCETDPLGFVVRYAYDANGNKTRITDRRGNSATVAYDPLNRATNTVDALGKNATIKYDLLGHVVVTTDRLGHSTSNSYDSVGRLTSIRDPEGNVKSNSYDVVGRLFEETAPNGTKTRYFYDPAGNVTNKIIGYGLASPRCMSSSYDLLGRPVRATDALGSYSINTYDPNGNPTNVATYNVTGQLLRSASLQYDARNQVVRKIDPLGNITSTEYDASGRKIADIDPLNNRVSCVYNIFGEVTATIDQLGARTTTVYDRRGQVVEVINSLKQRVRYQYDPNGNRTATIDDNGNMVITRYDALNRVQEVDRSMPAVAPDVLKRADVNRDGVIDTNDVQTLQGLLGQ